MTRHRISGVLRFKHTNERENYVRREQTLCGIEIVLDGKENLSCTFTGEFDCEDCKAEYALQLLADLP